MSIPSPLFPLAGSDRHADFFSSGFGWDTAKVVMASWDAALMITPMVSESLGSDTPSAPASKPDRPGQIVAVLFTEFDNVHGPIIAHQWPDDFVPQLDNVKDSLEIAKDMGLYGTYLIPHVAMSGLICNWSHGCYTFLTYPITFEHPRYFRNQYRTNLIFVFDANTDTKPYRSVLRKVSQSLQMLENDYQWLHKQSPSKLKKPKRSPDQALEAVVASLALLFVCVRGGHSPTQSPSSTPKNTDLLLQLHQDVDPVGPTIKDVLRTVQTGLNEKHEAIIKIDDGVVLSFKYFPTIPQPPEVRPWDVVVLVRPPGHDELSEWDLLLQLMVPLINSKRSVAELAFTLCVPIASALCAVRHLLYYGVARTIDIFQHSNIYMLNPATFHTWSDSPIGAEVLAFVSSKPRKPVSPAALIEFYRAFGTQPLVTPPDATASPFTKPLAAPALSSFFKHHNDQTLPPALKRVETVLSHFDQMCSKSRSTPSERKVERWRWRYEWHEEMQEKLSPRYAVAYGVLAGILRRVHEVPIFDIVKANQNPEVRKVLLEQERYRPLYNMLADAKGRCIDDICTSLRVSTGRAWSRSEVLDFKCCCNIVLR